VFVELLAEGSVGLVVDVRTAPGSRKHPQFGRDALSAALGAVEIEYVWRKDLGGWRTPRPDSPHAALRSQSFRGYADHMETPEFQRALQWLASRTQDVPTAIMCAESLWWNCHRRMIADALVVAGIPVVHLMSAGRREPHRVHPHARVVGTRLIYDVLQAGQARVTDEA